MAEYLNREDITKNITEIIKEAKKELIIISPFIKTNENIRELIKNKANNEKRLQIKIIYGKEELAKEEKEWILNIDKLELYFEKNTHAKCYFNDSKAIICSMNLHEYSQKNNFEMGILITKENDKNIYEKIDNDLNNILLNAKEITNKPTINSENNENNEIETKLDYEDKKIFEILKIWRHNKSKELKEPAYHILKDKEIYDIIERKVKNKEMLKTVKGFGDKKINKFGKEILEIIENSKEYQIVEVLSTFIQYNQYEGYDRVKIRYLSNNKEEWLDTKQNLPEKNKIIAVKINKNWFNDYFIVE